MEHFRLKNAIEEVSITLNEIEAAKQKVSQKRKVQNLT
jgi:hypothetical protein